MSEALTPCEEQGHRYHTYWIFEPKFRVIKSCEDCSDEYEIDIDEL